MSIRRRMADHSNARNLPLLMAVACVILPGCQGERKLTVDPTRSEDTYATEQSIAASDTAEIAEYAFHYEASLAMVTGSFEEGSVDYVDPGSSIAREADSVIVVVSVNPKQLPPGIDVREFETTFTGSGIPDIVKRWSVSADNGGNERLLIGVFVLPASIDGALTEVL